MISTPKTRQFSQRFTVRSPSDLPAEVEVRSAHLVGIGGTGMKALAELLGGLGCRVTGSDLALSDDTLRAMKQRGLRVHSGHHGDFLSQDIDVLVYSPAVGPANPERQLAARRGIPQMSYTQMVGWLMQRRVGISIAGTHGKSTTTALTAWILQQAGLSPSAVMGAEMCGLGLNGWAGEGELFVVESCEYQRNFLDFSPRDAVILGIEPDHFDYFTDFRDTCAAFAEFAAQLPSDGVLFVRGDCPHALAAARGTPAEVVTFSLHRGADWWAADLRRTPHGTRFRVFQHGDFIAELSCPLRGDHHVLNALAAVAVTHRLGVATEDLRESLYEFPGLRRRYERVGYWRGVTLIDDYAHHPTAVRATLQTARDEFGPRRIWCAFQPHQLSRTRALMSQFAESFSDANEILVAPVFTARETEASQDTAQQVAAELAVRLAADGRWARFCPSLDHIIATLEDEARPGEVLITMGAGDVDRVHHEFTSRLRRHHPAQ